MLSVAFSVSLIVQLYMKQVRNNFCRKVHPKVYIQDCDSRTW